MRHSRGRLTVIVQAGDRVFTLSGEDVIYRRLVETMHRRLTVTPEGTVLFCNRGCRYGSSARKKSSVTRAALTSVCRATHAPLEVVQTVRRAASSARTAHPSRSAPTFAADEVSNLIAVSTPRTGDC